MITIKVELDEDVAAALAQFVKRVGFSDARANAVSEEDAYTMLSGLRAVQKGLAEQGYAPR